MPPQVIDAIAPIAALVATGTFILLGMKMRLDAKVRMHAVARDDAAGITDTVEAFHDEVRLLRDDLADLQERVDFAERVLTKGQPAAEIEPPLSTPV